MPFPTYVFPSPGYRHLSLHGHLYSRQETTSTAFIIFNHLAVALGLFQYPVLDFLTFVLYLCTYYIFVAMSLKPQVPLYWHYSSDRSLLLQRSFPNRICLQIRLSLAASYDLHICCLHGCNRQADSRQG